MSKQIRIENWTFTPDTGALQDDADITRLEHRASALLVLLSRQPGRVFSQAEIIEQVWDGRAVSANSVAVTISDLRRALKDDPRQPRYIETLPKRGYRLIAEVTMPGDPSSAVDAKTPVWAVWRRPAQAVTALILGLGLILVAAGVLPPRSTGTNTLMVRVDAAINETGDSQYDPLTSSVTELVSVALAQHTHLKVGTAETARIVVSGKLILWDGHPAMSIHAASVASGETVWSGMASGPETLLPRQVHAEISEFAALADESETENW